MGVTDIRTIQEPTPGVLDDICTYGIIAKLPDDPAKRKKIFAWYWGHEHRCALYDQHPKWGVFGRCIGNGEGSNPPRVFVEDVAQNGQKPRARMAAEHVIGLGHRDVLIVGVEPPAFGVGERAQLEQVGPLVELERAREFTRTAIDNCHGINRLGR